MLLAMGRILQRERINHARVKLMKEAIKKIQKMKPEEFGKIVEKHQKQILEDAKIAELAAMSKKKQYRSVPFRMVSINGQSCGKKKQKTEKIILKNCRKRKKKIAVHFSDSHSH